MVYSNKPTKNGIKYFIVSCSFEDYLNKIKVVNIVRNVPYRALNENILCEKYCFECGHKYRVNHKMRKKKIPKYIQPNIKIYLNFKYGRIYFFYPYSGF